MHIPSARQRDQKNRLMRRYVSQLVATPRGRAHILSQAADAENNGEGQFFDALLSRVDDPELNKMIRIHQADEVRHAAMFRAAAERQGVPLVPVPDELKLIDRLDRKLGSTFFTREISTRTEIMEAYTLLQVVEERAVTQFAIFEPAFRAVDPVSADVFKAIGKDEERHLKYCHAISKRYAPDDFTLARTLRRFRELEAVTFAENGRANMRYSLRHGLLDATLGGMLGWWALAGLSEMIRGADPTPFLGGADERPGHAIDTLGPALAA